MTEFKWKVFCLVVFLFFFSCSLFQSYSCVKLWHVFTPNTRGIRGWQLTVIPMPGNDSWRKDIYYYFTNNVDQLIVMWKHQTVFLKFTTWAFFSGFLTFGQYTDKCVNLFSVKIWFTLNKWISCCWFGFFSSLFVNLFLFNFCFVNSFLSTRLVFFHPGVHQEKKNIRRSWVFSMLRKEC